MLKLVFATNNKYKVSEIRSLVCKNIEVLSLGDILCFTDIPETCDTLEGNASEKAFYIYNNCKANCFADDTGLEIEALNNMPGVLSARYAGSTKNPDDNMNKVLNELLNKKNRNARFRTIISLVIDGVETQFEGIVNGVILNEKRGSAGFGYDPIFMPNGYSISFAEMSMEEKNKISHRGIAFRKLTDYLNKL